MIRWRNISTCGFVVLTVAVAPHVAGSIHAQRPAADPEQRLYVPEGPLLRHASLGFHAPVADYIWLQAIQYYGGYRRGEHDLRYFSGLVEAVISLDPRFDEAYHFAALVLSLEQNDHQGALSMLKRGILANPDDWRLHFTVGFIHYVMLREWQLASFWFETAARLPGATDFCRRFAAFSARRAGDLTGSLLLWDHLARTTDSDDMRALARRMIDELQRSLRGEPLENAMGPPAPRGARRMDGPL
jgi:hypothetical protein